jgi:hypothetical protein
LLHLFFSTYLIGLSKENTLITTITTPEGPV